MKRFAKKIFWYILLGSILLVLFPWYLDPFNVFHVLDIRDNGVEPNKNFIKTSYLIQYPDKFDTYIFGSSRVGAINVDRFTGEECYNMTYSAGVPQEHYDNVKTFLKKGVNVKKLYVGLDSLSYAENPRDHYKQPLRMPYEYLKKDLLTLYKNYLDFHLAKGYIQNAFKDKTASNYQKMFYEKGSWASYGQKSKCDWKKAGPSIPRGEYIDETLASIAKIVKLCQEHDIELVVFTNPMHAITYKASLAREYLRFLKGLAQITDFYNFSSYNDVTANNDNYIETSHYKAEVGDLIIERIYEKKIRPELHAQGFGVHVTKENADEFIKFLARQANSRE